MKMGKTEIMSTQKSKLEKYSSPSIGMRIKSQAFRSRTDLVQGRTRQHDACTQRGRAPGWGPCVERQTLSLLAGPGESHVRFRGELSQEPASQAPRVGRPQGPQQPAFWDADFPRK